jgi:hypothetical protein
MKWKSYLIVAVIAALVVYLSNRVTSVKTYIGPA